MCYLIPVTILSQALRAAAPFPPFCTLEPRTAGANLTSAHTSYTTSGKSLYLSGLSLLFRRMGGDGDTSLSESNKTLHGKLSGTPLGFDSSCWESQVSA